MEDLAHESNVLVNLLCKGISCLTANANQIKVKTSSLCIHKQLEEKLVDIMKCSTFFFFEKIIGKKEKKKQIH